MPIPGELETFAVAHRRPGSRATSCRSRRTTCPWSSVNLAADPDAGLAALREALEAALAEPLTVDADDAADAVDTAPAGRPS